jgi:hypothetical protein
MSTAMISIPTAIRRGVSTVLGQKRFILVAWLANVALALPASWLMKDALEKSIGASLVHENLRRGFDLAWFSEFEANARGLETTFGPSLSGAGPFYGNAEGWVTGQMFANLPGLVALGIVHALVWMFLLAGVLDAYVRPDRDLLASGGRYFLRFLQLAAVSAVFYFLVYSLARWLFQTLHRLSRDVTVERTVLAYALAAAVVVALLLAFVNMVFDYAKIALVVRENGGALPALRDALRFIRLRALLLYLVLACIGIGLLAVFAVASPGGRQSSAAGVVFAFVVGQIFLVAKLCLRLTFYGSQAALYSSQSA